MIPFWNVFKTLSHDDKKSVEMKRFGIFLGLFDNFFTEAFFVEKFYLFLQKPLNNDIFHFSLFLAFTRSQPQNVLKPWQK